MKKSWHPMMVVAVLVILGAPSIARAHCDTLDGPVVATARAAIDKRDVTPVLKWVQKKDENEIRELFNKTIAVRAKGKDAQELADRYFFETLVRIHRAGEGAPYTGMKPAGQVEPSIAAADKAIDSGTVDALVKMITDAAAAGLRQRYSAVREAKKTADESVDAGRKYVAAYVDFTHYVERLDMAAGAAHQGVSPEPSAKHDHHDAH